MVKNMQLESDGKNSLISSANGVKRKYRSILYISVQVKQRMKEVLATWQYLDTTNQDHG